ncbi:hypothetical protein [Corynebacterium falsenii]|uniref:hypothetical protein n=1 Tax=Corynebacterium falsenii TaxID=108486 RepID=UPI0011827C38|nr:hypothetical protein [Corynebacterium falsenii]MDC7102923.1 hypothetical protein [Corynebacterium falsenii]UBI04372.1 hypothetical protein LA343_10430 [Corynebacterium falsenii]UBI07594.1 hypothetical protein LA329_04635 [Corynebacterium falsenii]HJF11828.1 hypothetical protein [Corynebacterium falsenii]
MPSESASPRRRGRRVFGKVGGSGRRSADTLSSFSSDATPRIPDHTTAEDLEGQFDKSFWEEQRPPHWG